MNIKLLWIIINFSSAINVFFVAVRHRSYVITWATEAAYLFTSADSPLILPHSAAQSHIKGGLDLTPLGASVHSKSTLRRLERVSAPNWGVLWKSLKKVLFLYFQGGSGHLMAKYMYTSICFNNVDKKKQQQNNCSGKVDLIIDYPKNVWYVSDEQFLTHNKHMVHICSIRSCLGLKRL